MKNSVKFSVAIISIVLLAPSIWIPFISKNFTHLRFRFHFYRLLFNSSTPHAHTHCLIYDKAPRTGSSTILHTLRQCWKSSKFRFRRPRRVLEGHTFAEECVNDIHHERIVIGGNHFYMGNHDIELIAKECKHIFYVTSTRKMKERLLSKAKYDASSGKIAANSTLNGEDWKKVQHRLSRYKDEYETVEKNLERYPFVSPRWAITPDYVIRSDSLFADLGLLLHAFGCNTTIRSQNIHTVSDIEKDEGEEEEEGPEKDDADEVVEMVKEENNTSNGLHDKTKEELTRLKEIHLVYNDRRHERMLRHASLQNRYGLLKVTTQMCVKCNTSIIANSIAN